MLAYNFSILPSLSITLEEVSFPYWNSPVISSIEEKKDDDEVYITDQSTENSIEEKKNDSEINVVQEKETKPTVDDLKLSEEKLQYWIYDLPSCPGNFSERNAELRKIFAENPDIFDDSFVLVEQPFAYIVSK